ncbi:MAG: efflux RND transporter periplasmic adaptor subunit [Spirochaetia bacterium]|nr:efflux RND transporter periplasmic adaptor subunit [Spirochaetia bacterium]
MKKRRKKTIYAAAVVMMAGVAAYFLLGTLSLGEPETESSNTGNEIAVVEAKPGTISVKVEGPSVVEPYRTQEIRSSLGGMVIEAVEEGEKIEQGEVLAHFDDTDQRNDRRQAELDLQQAKLDLQRAQLAYKSANLEFIDKQSLFSSGSIPKTELEAARDAEVNAEFAVNAAEIKVAQSTLALEKAVEQLDKTLIRAPFSGVVLQAGTSAGDVMSSGASLMTFADLSRLRLRAEVDEFDIGKVQLGMPVEITADSLGNEVLRSTVERVSPAAEVINNISIFTVSTVLRAVDGGLRPGMSADISILISDDTGLIVPSGAVSSVRGRSYLEVYENEEVVTTRVTAGADDGTNLVITDGLPEGALVVVPQTAGFTLGEGASTSSGSSIIPINMPGSGGSR